MNRRPHPYVTADRTAALLAHGASELAARLAASDMTSTDEAARIAKVDAPTIEAWAEAGRVIAMRDRAGAFRLPKWQFDGNLWPSIVRLSQSHRAPDSWALLSFLETPLGALNGRTPRQALELGDGERVIALARDHL